MSLFNNDDTNLNSFSELDSLKGLKIVHLNTCSLVNKIDEIRQTLIGTSSIDILCITETWLKPYHDTQLFEIDNYVLYRLDRTRLSISGSYIHGGGIACYVNNRLASSKTDLDYTSLDIELLIISLRHSSQRPVSLLISYRPPSGNCSVALNKLTDCVTELRLGKGRFSLILCGDLNIDISKSKQTPNVKALINFCRESSLYCMINSPTRFSLSTSSVIDLFLTDSLIV